jgi:hypothetical protein
MRGIIALSAIVLLSLHGQPVWPGVERNFNVGCIEIEQTAKEYLRGRGFARTQCPEPICANILTSPEKLLDAKGHTVGTARIRCELSAPKPPIWLWSSPLHADVFLWMKGGNPGCNLRLWIDFVSFHTMVAGVLPVGEKLGLPSNGRLEAEYLDAIEEAVKKDPSAER